MAGYKIVDAEKLDADLTSVANAIRKKAGTTEKMEFPGGFESAVKNIPRGGAELPELGDTAAQPTDIVADKVLYDDKGNPVTGTLIEADEIDEALFANRDFTFGGTPGGTTFSVKGAYAGNTDGVVVRIGAGLGVKNAPTDFFGDARPEDVTKGKKFTSAAGLLVEGTHEDEGGVELPELTNPAAASDLALDKQLIDADGNVVTGTLADVTDVLGLAEQPDSVVYSSASQEIQILSGMYSPTDFIARSSMKFRSRVPAAEFGDATANQVSKRTTFTSANGLLVPGELPDGGMVRLIGGKAYGYFGDGNGVLLEASADVDRIIRAGDEVGVVATYNQFGDAMPGDVRKGTTFTSSAGFLARGELEVPSFTVTDDGKGNVTITSSSIADNNGNVVIE